MPPRFHLHQVLILGLIVNRQIQEEASEQIENLRCLLLRKNECLEKYAFQNKAVLLKQAPHLESKHQNDIFRRSRQFFFSNSSLSERLAFSSFFLSVCDFL